MTTVRIWFKKEGEASYISLLDLQRVFQRVFKRSRLPVWHTLGFNPHIYMTFGCPLPLGQESLCENVDIKTEAENLDFAAWQNQLNEIMPRGIHVFCVEPAAQKADDIGFAEYKILLRGEKTAAAIEDYNLRQEAVVLKKTKKGNKEFNLKQYIPALSAEETEAGVQLALRVPTSAELTVNPALLLNFMEQEYGLPAAEAGVLRTGLFTKDGKKFAPNTCIAGGNDV